MSEVSVHASDHINADFFGTYCLTFAVPGTDSEPLSIHLLDHTYHSALTLWLSLREQAKMRDLGPDKE